MEHIRANPKRLLWAINERACSVEQLASDADISREKLEQVLTGESSLTFNQLRRVAKILERGLLFFVEDGEPDESRTYSANFRSLLGQRPSLSPKMRAFIDRVEQQREVFLALNDELGSSVRFVDPGFTFHTPKHAAALAREWLGLTAEHSFDGFRKAVEAKSILVFRSNGYQGKWQMPPEDQVEGMCLHGPICPVIVIRKAEYEARQTFTLFHELGHILLHGSNFIDSAEDLSHRSDSLVERQANEFAGNLLVPDHYLDSISLGHMPNSAHDLYHSLGPWKRKWGVSYEMLAVRLLSRSMISQAQFDALESFLKARDTQSSSGGDRSYRHREPVHLFGTSFAKTVFEALDRKVITSSRAGRYLDNINLSDVRKLEGYVATL
jgi:Zn-dependent peptidase ImmA (M78 family)